MNAILLVILAVMPPQSVAPPQSVPEPAAIASIPDATGEPTVTVLPCQCGDTCECADCQCADCPHSKENGQTLYDAGRTVKESLQVRPPHLVASVWTSGCVYGERWLSEAYPELIAKGWRIEVRRVSPDSGVACPTFTMGTRTWSGYTSKSAHFAKLVTAMGEPERVTHDAQRHDAAKPVQAHHLSPGLHSHQCPCGNRWTHDANAITDFYSAHTCRRCGRLVTVHAE